MLIITDVLSELGLDMKTFAKHYEKTFDKKLSSKTKDITKKDLESIKKSLSSNSKEISHEEKVLKASEFLGGGGGFLSGLGFVDEESEKQNQEIEEEKMIPTTDDLLKNSISHKQHSTTRENIPSNRSRPERPRPERPRPTTNNDVRRPNSNERGNLNFTKSEYVPNVKKVEQRRSSSTATPPQHGGNQTQQTNRNHSVPYNNRPHNNSQRTHSNQRNNIVSNVRKAQATPAQVKKPKIATTSENLVKKKEVVIGNSISVKEFSEKLGIPLPEVIKVLMKNKLMLGISSVLDFDTATLIADELGVIAKQEENNQLDVESFMEGDLQAILAMDKVAPYLRERAPIVTIMGHVDHGKTSLLDYLRKTTVAGGEAGGITQGIGASAVNYEGKQITFIDTPGHELFTELRSRGSKLTNIAVIVVAADDSVMPQTIESINHAKAAGVPIIIAITKIDKPGKNIEQIKSDLASYGITPEDWGGDSPIVGISSITGEGIPDLLETILLQAEILELKYNPQRAAVGVVLDAYKDPKQGVVSTIIVMTGTLKVGDVIVAYNTYGKVRRIQDRTGKVVKSATGGDPVQILGITELPEAGRVVEVVKSEKEAHDKITLIQEQTGKKIGSGAVQEFLTRLQSNENDETHAELRLILKSGGASSLSALKQAVASIKLPSNVEIKVVHSDVGHFSDSDLSLGQASKALLVGFGISINSTYRKKADIMGVTVKNFDIIYELTAYLGELTQGMIKYEQIEVVIAKLNILGIFFSKGKEMTVGGKILEGKLKNKVKFRVLRDGEVFANGTLMSLHKNRDEVKEMNEGEECGLKVKVGKKIEEGDILEFYEMQDKKD